MTSLILGNGLIQLSPEAEAYNTLRLKFQKYAENSMADFSDKFAQNFADMDQLHERCTQIALQYLSDPIDEAIRDLVAIRIMDIDDDQFRNQYLAPHLTWAEDFGVIDDKYLEIVLKAQELEAYRTARRENQVGVIGGGFGFEGAIRGVAVATALNIGLGVVQGALNAGVQALSSMGDKQKKMALYHDSLNSEPPSRGCI